ncbi:hemicentin 1 [Echinococcus multilocularis]|uniref:Hemicentin 1 n=1 Tax=Echinococcus multilocularis TaxID=6211 RepID=A0A068Y0E2_ECHMU|nr:hemicentin 1 [Echinococcus multilocularis]
MWPALLAVLISAYAVWCGDSLILIDEYDFIPKLPNSNDWDFVIQNPYKGVVEVLRSPTNKFQVLLNASFEENHDWGLYYTLRTGSNEMFLQLSTRVIQQRVYTDIEEDTVYLQLLLITVASLVLVVFVVSIIFSCWWVKSRHENLEPVPCYVDASEKPEYAEDCRLDGNGTLNADGEIELISLGQNIFNSYENDAVKSKVTGGEYTTFTALAGSKENAEEGREGTVDGAKPSTEANATLPGTTHTLPRYSIAGNNGAGGSGAVVIGVPPSIISSTVASTVNTFGASLPRMSGVESVGMTGLKLGHSSTTGRTRHMAKEFLDESVLNTAARKLKGSNEQAMRRPPLSNIVSTAGTACTAPQQVILLPAASTGTAGGEQAFLLASTADGIMRPLSPIRVVEAIEPSASVLNPCAIHPAAGTAAATPGATLFVQVGSTQTPIASTELQRLSPSLHTTASGVPILTDEFLAEMAACPQHSYLLRQQMSTTFETSPPIAAVTAAAATPATNIVGVPADPSADVTYPFEAPPAPALRRRSHDLLESSADKPSASGKDTAVGVVEEASQTPCKPSESASQRPASPGYSETLPRTVGRSSSHSNSIESDLNKPGSSATLPVGSSSTGARKSALKGARGSKISKQIRFTVLNIVAISCIVTVAMATKTVDNTADGEGGVQVMNVIRFPATSVDANSTESLGGPPVGPQLRITIWIPIYFNLGEAEVKHSMGSDSVSNSTLERKPPKSIQLWLNRTSRTEVRLGPNVHRSAVEIYDAVDARWIQSTRSCRQRYVCDHSCDPGAGHACICQRGYRPAGPEDRSRLIGYGSGAADGIKGQGRVCLDVDECEDAAVRAECTQRGGVCTNRPGDHQCLCPSGRTCLREFTKLACTVVSRLISLGFIGCSLCCVSIGW